MSVARHHAEWLSLLETSGSFLSLPVLLRVFPQGLDAHDPALARALRLAHDEWDENRAAKRPDPRHPSRMAALRSSISVKPRCGVIFIGSSSLGSC